MTGWTTPSPKMAGFITVVLLAMFGGVLFGPTIWKQPAFDPALVQTLLVLLVGSVGYYLGSSKSSEEKNATIATQAATAAAVAGVQLVAPTTAPSVPAAPVTTEKASP